MNHATKINVSVFSSIARQQGGNLLSVDVRETGCVAYLRAACFYRKIPLVYRIFARFCTVARANRRHQTYDSQHSDRYLVAAFTARGAVKLDKCKLWVNH
eukprot:596223_1